MVAQIQTKHSTRQGESLHLVHCFNSFSKGQQNQGKDAVFPSLDTLDHNCRDLTVSERKAERLFTRQTTKDKLLKLYQTANLSEESFKLENCCKKFGTLKCSGNHVQNYYPTERCRLALCPDCAIYRQKRAFQRLFPKFQQFARNNPKDRLVLITLTLKNTSDNLLEIHRFFKKSFRKLRQKKNWKTKMRGGIVSFELTIDKNGLSHYHAHILAQRKSFDRYEQSDLSDDWNKVTDGKGFIVDIRQVSDLKDGFREVLKYSFKPLDLEKNRFDSDKLRQFNELSKRARLAESFGEFYGLEVEEIAENEHQPEQLEAGSPCPTCAEPLHFVLLTRNELTSVLLGQNLLFKPPLIC
jgi:hypothetical protein